MADKKAKATPAKKKAPVAKTVNGFVPLKFKEFTITQKRSGRYQVLTADGKNINGIEKEKLLLESKVLTRPAKKPAKEEVAAT